ncbi:hypothetical protein M2352_004995 [Azospirillum fermentarium]|uniref:cellulose biosynthesis cyclic di-GMP-binding regulatory protein BcsB n=1 Tax=Azospirillum fermentarium TaxID=1233114 RepID=UPI002226E65A|nr:cellulose biosynthesis cyclic di-GMP-binding regulatory protein BcsB [Azospirillum fermentarium]MCW2249335.1 hypothetical protein [Azospirillum fermentarium]
MGGLRGRWRGALAGLVLAAAGMGAAGDAAAEAGRRVVPLASLRPAVAPAPAAGTGAAPAGNPADVLLSGEDDTLTLPLTLPPVGHLSSVVLTIGYENSIDILPEKGGLTLLINGVPVAELPLSAFKGPVNAAVTLPPDLIRPGENRIAIRAQAQHRAICSVRGTYDLWTKIRLADSSLVLVSGDPPPVPDLAMLRPLLAAADRLAEPLTILTPGPLPGPDHLGWGALVAGFYGLVLDERAPVVAAAPMPPSLDGAVLPGGKNILIGTRDEVAPFLGESRTSMIAGPFLAIYPAGGPAGAGGFVAVVSGRTPAEVDQAVRRLTDPTRPLPPQTMAVGDAPATVRPEPPALPPVGEGRHRLSDLGFASVSHTGYRYHGQIPLRLPVGYAPVPDRSMILRVNAAFEGDLGPGAVLNVRVNGRPAASLEVDKRSSGLIRRGEMPLPMGLFQAGLNVIEVNAEMPPAGGTDCVFAVRRPVFTLDGSSEIEIPGFARTVTLPALDATARTGFPYGPVPGRGVEPFSLLVMGKDPVWFGAAWTLTARMAQAAESLLYPVPLTAWNGPPAGNAVIVGPVGGLPQSAFAGAALTADQLAGLLEAGGLMAQAGMNGDSMAAVDRRALADRLRAAWAGRTGTGISPSPRSLAGPVQAQPVAAAPDSRSRWQQLADAQKISPVADLVPDWITRILARVTAAVTRWTAPETAADVASQTLNADILPEAALLQFRAPGGEDAAWTVLTAPEPRAMARAMQSFAQAGVWDRLRGGATLWTSAAPAVTSLSPPQPFQVILNPLDVGNLILILARTLSQRIEILFALLLGAAVVLAVSMHLLLKRGHEDREGR